MASLRQQFEIVIDGKPFTAKTSLEAVELIESDTGMGILQLLRDASVPALPTAKVRTILGRTLWSNGGRVSENTVRQLVEKIGYIESIKTALTILGPVVGVVSNGAADDRPADDGAAE